jgi:hypothetical protein
LMQIEKRNPCPFFSTPPTLQPPLPTFVSALLTKLCPDKVPARFTKYHILEWICFA